jgi:hypothetical protein
MVPFLSLDLLENLSFFFFAVFFRFFLSWVGSEGLSRHEDSYEELVPKRPYMFSSTVLSLWFCSPPLGSRQALAPDDSLLLSSDLLPDILLSTTKPTAASP